MAHGVGFNESGLSIQRLRNTVISTKTLESSSTTSGLVGEHTTDCAPEDLVGGTEVERSTSGVDVAALAKEAQVLQLRAVEVAGNVDVFASDNRYLLSKQELLGHGAG